MERVHPRLHLEGQESARTSGKSTGGTAVTDDHMLSMAPHLRGKEVGLRDIAARLVITRVEEGTAPALRDGPPPAPRARRSEHHDVSE